jgi:hypothetical protein
LFAWGIELKRSAFTGENNMKTKDFVLAALIALNLFLLVAFVGSSIYTKSAQPEANLTAVLESTAHAGSSSDSAGFFRICAAKIGDKREAVAVIDTATNQLTFYARLPGKFDYEKIGDTVDLGTVFGHSSPKRP